MARIWTGVRSAQSHLQRLAIVFADELRLKIVTELYMREMSPKGFYAQFGGGSVSRVDHHFKRLAEYGWLRFIRSESGGGRRGGVEHFYRATELACFDHETWCCLPYSVKAAFSWRIYKQFSERIVEAMEAGTFDYRSDRHLTWRPVVVDRAGWERVIGAIDSLFEGLFDEQADAKLRIFNSGASPMLATVALAGFESPMLHKLPDGPRLVDPTREPSVPLPPRLSKVFADEVCLRIVAEANVRELSATEFYAEFGGQSIDGIRRRFRALRQLGWLAKVGERSGGRRRGAAEVFYRATGPAIFGNPEWSEVPRSIRQMDDWAVFHQLTDKVMEAMWSGAFDAREDRHLTWSLLRLDRQGWMKISVSIDEVIDLVLEEAEGAKSRMAMTGEDPITMTVALAAFESPESTVKAP